MRMTQNLHLLASGAGDTGQGAGHRGGFCPDGLRLIGGIRQTLPLILECVSECGEMQSKTPKMRFGHF